MDNMTINLNDIAISIYERMDNDDIVSSSVEDLKELSNSILKDIDEKMVRELDFDKCEEVFTLILEYGEFCGKQKFIEGFAKGVKVARLISEI